MGHNIRKYFLFFSIIICSPHYNVSYTEAVSLCVFFTMDRTILSNSRNTKYLGMNE